jgi:hypothetical protein
MASKNILSIEPNMSLLKLVKFYGMIKKRLSCFNIPSFKYNEELFTLMFDALIYMITIEKLYLKDYQRLTVKIFSE